MASSARKLAISATSQSAYCKCCPYQKGNDQKGNDQKGNDRQDAYPTWLPVKIEENAASAG
jgi:hypothetical protein